MTWTRKNRGFRTLDGTLGALGVLRIYTESGQRGGRRGGEWRGVEESGEEERRGERRRGVERRGGGGGGEVR